MNQDTNLSKDKKIQAILEFNFREKQPESQNEMTCKYCNRKVDKNATKVWDADSSPAALDLMRHMFLMSEAATEIVPSLSSFRWELRKRDRKAKRADFDAKSSSNASLEIKGESKKKTEMKTVYLRGDTLLTCKIHLNAYIAGRNEAHQRDRFRFAERISSNEVFTPTNSPINTCPELGHYGIVNNQYAPSLFLIPHNSISLNICRAQAYKDNPFTFFTRLRELYLNDFLDNKNSLDEMKVSERNLTAGIIETWGFWQLFGKGEAGFENMLKVFCLEDISDSRYDTFRNRPLEDKEYKINESYLTDYLEALRTLGEARFNSMKERLKSISEKDPTVIDFFYDALYSSE